MTLELYARRQEWPLESVTIELSHERVHARDCDECEEDREGYVDLIRRRIVMTGDLSDEQRERLGQIAQRCPIAKTLENDPKIVDDVRLAGGASG